jgi:hypothetical protein
VKRGLGSLVLSFVVVAFALAGIWAGLVVWRSPVGFSDEESPAVIFYGAALGTATAVVGYLSFRNLKRLLGLSRASRGEGPADGEHASIVGALEARTDEVLSAPFSGRRALAWKYAITRTVPTRRGSRAGGTIVTAFQGEAMVPCEITTESGRIPLLARPTLVDSGDIVEGDEAYAKARVHLAARFPEAFGADSPVAPPLDTGDEADRQFEATGGFQRDEPVKIPSSIELESPFDVSRWTLRESIYPSGGMVCATGVWSSERGGLLPQAGGLEELLLEHGNAAAASASRRSNLGCLAIVGLLLLFFQVLLGFKVWLLGS